MSLPIIKLSVDRMQHEVYTALTNYEAQLDSYIKEAIEQVCSENNIRSLVKEAVITEMQDCIKRSAEAFYKYGEGNKLIAELVIAKLKKEHSIP